MPEAEALAEWNAQGRIESGTYRCPKPHCMLAMNPTSRHCPASLALPRSILTSDIAGIEPAFPGLFSSGSLALPATSGMAGS